MRIYSVTLIIISISLAILSSSLINLTYAQVNETSQTQTYENRDMGIRLSYPSDWGKFEVIQDCDKDVCTLGTKGTGFTLALLALSEQACNCNLLTDFVRGQYKISEQKHEDFSFIGDNQTTVGKKYPGWRYEFSFLDSDNANRTSLNVLTTNNQTYLRVNLAYLNDSKANLLPQFKNVIDSIEFLPIQVAKTPSFMNTNESQTPTIFEKTLPPITVGDRQASLYTKISPPDKNQNAPVQLRLFDSNTGNNITNVNYFLTISKGGKQLMKELFYSKEGPLNLKFQPNQSPITVHGTTEPFLGGWMNETGPITISGPILTEGGLYQYTVEIFGVDNVRNIFVPENAPRFDSSFSLDMNGTEQTKPSSTFQTNPSSVLESNPTGLQILSHNSFTDSLDYLHVVGEVQNNSPTNAQFVQITGTFYDSNNQVVGTQFTYTNPSDIGAGQKAPFELILTSASVPVSQIDHYNLQASSQ